jgi:thiamine biosynthesis lipoprotein
MGTLVEITMADPQERSSADAITGAFQEMRRIENIMSRRLEGSAVWEVNQAAGVKGVVVSHDLISVIQVGLQASHLSTGAFDVTLGSLIGLWARCWKEDRLPSKKEVEAARRLVGYEDLEVDEEKRTLFLKRRGMELALGGIAKGYAVDQACRVLQGLGFRDFIINAGGDLRTGGTKFGSPWVVGIQNPRDKSKIIARMRIQESAIATSGDYERYFVKDGVRYHHILDPVTGFPARDCQSVTILSNELIWADALATAVFVLGPTRGISLVETLPETEAMIVDQNGRFVLSTGMEGRVSFE